MKLFKVYTLLAVFLLGIAVNSLAQEWSAPQEEVWGVIESEWKDFAANDQEAFLKHFHADYKGFVNWRALPLDKANLEKWVKNMLANTSVTVYTVQPAAITVKGDTAVVLYYCDLNLAFASGQQKRASFRYTTTLQKYKDKWLIIGAHKEEVE